MKATLLLFVFILNGCTFLSADPSIRECGFNDNCYRERGREGFIRLSPEEREKEREKCLSAKLYSNGDLAKPVNMVEYCTKGLYARLHAEPTLEELEKLKKENAKL